MARLRSGSGVDPDRDADAEVLTGRHRLPRSGRPRVLELPAAFTGARIAPSAAAVLGVLAVVVLVAFVFGARVWLTRAQEPSQVIAPDPPSTGAPGVVRGTSTLQPSSTATPPGSSGGPSGAAAGPASGGLLVVHVVGQVSRPGVQRLPPGARVEDAITAAGGATRTADLAAVNLARVLVDGEQLRVPRPGEEVSVPGIPAGPTTPGGTGAAGSPGGSAAGGLVSLNAADLAALDSLPGVGPVLAQRILDWRTEHGRFTSIDELGEVSGIGEKLLSQIRPKVTL